MTQKHYPYARFWKCALQVNPHGYSGKYRGQEHGMDAQTYAQAMRDICLEEGIEVVGFADHGKVAEAEVAREILNKAGIVVFPGFEVATTEKVHWVCLFPETTTAQQLERYLGRLDLTDPQDGIRPSNLGGHDLLDEVEKLGGFVYGAHITQSNGLLMQKLPHLWKDRRLHAAQIPGPIDDLPHGYRSIVLNKNLDYSREQPIALINAKDVAEPNDLKYPGASCSIKMTRPCFDSFMMAFKDPGSRIRLSHETNERNYSRIESISIEGGYFDGLSAHISDHLNAVIGGRGTGKSTLLECVRYALDISHKGDDAIKQGEQIVKENLGREGGTVTLNVSSAVNHSKSYKVTRRYGESPQVFDEEGNESRLHPGRDILPGIEIYGQNEIYEIAKKPESLARVLDRFLPDSAEQESLLVGTYRKLKENGDRLVKAREKKEEIELQIAKIPKLEERVRQFKEHGLDEKLKQLPLLEKERQLVPRIMEEIDRVRTEQRGLDESLPDLVFLNDKVLEGLPHADLLRRGRDILDMLASTLRQNLIEIDKIVGEAEKALESVIKRDLIKAMEVSEKEIEKEFAGLPSAAGKDGKEIGRTYQLLLREVEQIKPIRSQLKTVDALIDELEQNRRNLVGEISEIRSERTAAKKKVVGNLNKRLARKLRITLVPDGLRQPLRDFLQELPGVGERKTLWVDESPDLTIFALVAAIREGKNELLEKQWGLTPGLIDTLTKMTAGQIDQLEGIDLQDRITLELNVSHSDEQYKPLNRISTGQQCTAILHLLLLDNQDPLIMDQPEDNLDNAFIAERIVQELRTAKTKRQFLFATHNANIPVFGDAEWIGVCSVSGEKAEMPEETQGSIDIPSIRDQVTSILEGGREAFVQRKEKYGFD
ncbi:TrlF family AAA-like ATPase [Thioalkalivibrio sp. HK1]|uniref:TrlF family AAA-like ATPase n=1 Tax=Thioalkalivibrio sp. HK1 TaxID=1469245 RepID=UPI00046F97B5|nr:hypothetical protein [Thioalkalivibrio sp. HK1]